MNAVFLLTNNKNLDPRTYYAINYICLRSLVQFLWYTHCIKAWKTFLTYSIQINLRTDDGVAEVAVYVDFPQVLEAVLRIRSEIDRIHQQNEIKI